MFFLIIILILVFRKGIDFVAELIPIVSRLRFRQGDSVSRQVFSFRNEHLDILNIKSLPVELTALSELRKAFVYSWWISNFIIIFLDSLYQIHQIDHKHLVPIITWKLTSRVNFLIAGDGPKRILIEEVIEKHKLQKR